MEGFMRLAILSDIHGNLVALDTVMNELSRRSIDRYICLGDVACSGPQPHAVLQRLMQLDWPIVQGNTDAWLLNPSRYTGDDPFYRRIDEIAAWCEAQLTDQDKVYLKTFEPVLELSLGAGLQLLGYHGSPRSNEEFITATTPELVLREIIANLPQKIFVGGHTHQQLLSRYEDVILINPGSVGLPYEKMRSSSASRNVPWAEFAVLSWEAGHLGVEFCRTPLSLMDVKRGALESGMPHAEWWAEEWVD
jgi:predicted phosphodiesterase